MIKKNLLSAILIVTVLFTAWACSENPTTAQRWSVNQANEWYNQYPFLAGGNYVPASAINQLEMWQEDTFDAERIDFEFRKASLIGMNTMRVFLHDLAWKQDSEGFFSRVDLFLDIAEKYGIKIMFVFFDGVWNPYPKVGKQPEPTPHVHNSGWVQSPGREILQDSKKQDKLKKYVQSVLSRYKDDERVLIWDLFNEPDNDNAGNFGGGSKEPDLPGKEKKQRALELLKKTFEWAREINPSQPLTVGVWGNPTWLEACDEIEKFSLENSDVISFHSYSGPDKTEKIVEGLQKYNRPIMCTEYMARSAGSTFEGILPIFHKNRVAAYNWGLFSGKSQTIYPWSSWKKEFTEEPKPWFHDVFRKDGTPYDKKETTLIKKLLFVPNTVCEIPPKVAKPDSRETIEKGLKSHNKALFIKEHWIRDPYITLGPDDYYYLTGTTPNPGDEREQTDPYNIGLGDISIVGSSVQVWKSKDLIDWEYLGTPYGIHDSYRLSKGLKASVKEHWAASKEVLWAPEIHWLGDKWALVHCPKGRSSLAFSEGAEVKGPWVHPMGEAFDKKHDPSLFQDDDGKWYALWKNTYIARIKDDFSGFDTEPVFIPPSGERPNPAAEGKTMKQIGHEGATMVKIGNKYINFGTAWSTDLGRKGSYNLYYCESENIFGPYGPRKFVGRFLGHGTPFQTRDGKWWCTAFFNANMPPLEKEGIENKNLMMTASTINQRGTTIVPLDVFTNDKGEVIIRAKDPDYATPGPDEAQNFSKKE